MSWKCSRTYCSTCKPAAPVESPPDQDVALSSSMEQLNLHFRPKYTTRFTVKDTAECKSLNAIWNDVIDAEVVDTEEIAVSAEALADDDYVSLLSNWNHWISGFNEVSSQLRGLSGLQRLYGNWSLLFAVAVALRITKSSGERLLAKRRSTPS